MTRVSYLLYNYPALSETYVTVELDHVSLAFDLDIVSLLPTEDADELDLPYVVVRDPRQILARLRSLKPDVIHTHWLWGPQLATACVMARKLDRPLTVRAHSFDVLQLRPDDTRSAIGRHLDFLRSDHCLGILTFPFGVQPLTQAGIPEEKLIPCFPVVDYARFHDESPNGSGIMNTGACLPKKDFPSYLEFAHRMPDLECHLYPTGAQVPALRAANQKLGGPVTIHTAVPHGDMRRVYKQYEWLLYTADRAIATVGWPMCVAEAQAAGVGVCMPNLRPDIAELLGPAGFVYDSLDEVGDIIRRGYPPAMREAGFAHARRSDIREHLHLLTDLWQQ